MAVINTKNADSYKDKEGCIQATDEADKVTMGSSNDTIYGNLGNDSINGGSGNDRIFGDNNSYSGGNDTIRGGKGNDYIVDYIGLNYLYGDAGDDTLEGRDNASYFDGGKGNDYILASQQADTIMGSDGNDFIDGNGNNDIINGGKGVNLIKISNQSDDGTQITIKHGKGSDYIQLFGFTDNAITKYIKSVNDLILELQSNEKFIYIKLENYFKYGTKFSVKGILNTAGNTALTWDKKTDWANIIKSFTDGNEYNSIEYLLQNSYLSINSKGKSTGSTYSDSIIGSNNYDFGNDTIKSLKGNDTLYGGIGDDKLYGGDGNNVYQFESNQGRNIIYPNKYNSTTDYTDIIKLSDYTFTNPNEQVLTFYDDNNKNLVIEYNNTQITIYNYFKLDGNTTLKSIVDVNGTELRDIEGSAFNLRNYKTQIKDLIKSNITAKNSTIGGDGFDILTATKSGSTLIGGKGNDKLNGGKGNDIFKIEANSGHDTIYSSKGQDTIDATTITFLSDDMTFYKDGNDLVLYYGEIDVYSESITFANYFKSKYDCTINYNSTNTVKLSELLTQKILKYNTDSSVKKNISGTIYNDSIVGTDFNDKINTGAGSNIVKTFGGNDTITVGNDNNNYIDSGDGNDKITVGNGNNGLDSLGAREGYESYGIYSGNGNHTINIGKGNNYINIGNGNNKITAKSGNNILIAGNGINNINLGNGNNTITTGDGDNNINLGKGNNSVTTGSGKEKIKIGDGNNTITSGDGDKNITLGKGNNQITIGKGNNIIKVGNGNNTIAAGNGNNKITAKDGNNSITTDSGNDTINAGDGNCTISSGTGKDILTLGSGINIINLSQGDGYLTVNQSTKGLDTYNLIGIDSYDDLTFTKDSSDALIICNNDDELLCINKYFKNSSIKDIQISTTQESKSITEVSKLVIDKSSITKNQKIVGTILNDSIISGSGSDNITGGDGNDTIISGDGNDIIYAGNGNDSILGGKGNDFIQGGLGTNIIEYYAGDGNDTISMTENEIININYYNKDKNSEYTLLDFKDKIYVKGNDVIIKFSETDSITIKDLAYKELADSVNFQAYYLNNYGEYVGSFYKDNLIKPIDLKSSYLFPADYSQKSTKNINGSILADSIVGNSEDNTIKAGKGNDYILANKGNDKIYGEHGNNTIVFIQGDGNDTIYSGNDKSSDFNDILKLTTDSTLISIDDCTDEGYVTENRIIGKQKNNDLIIKYGENDSITVSDYFKDIAGSKFDSLIINDEEKTITDNIYIIYDNITSVDNLDIDNTPLNSIIYCGSGDDTINAGKNNSIIFGGEGNDYYNFMSTTTNFSKLNVITDIMGENDTIYLDFNHNDLYLYMDISATVTPEMEEPEGNENEMDIGGTTPGMDLYEITSPDLYIMTKENYGDKTKGILLKSQFDQWEDKYKIENIITKDDWHIADISIDMLKESIGTYLVPEGRGSCENIILSKDEEIIEGLQNTFTETLWTNETFT